MVIGHMAEVSGDRRVVMRSGPITICLTSAPIFYKTTPKTFVLAWWFLAKAKTRIYCKVCPSVYTEVIEGHEEKTKVNSPLETSRKANIEDITSIDILLTCWFSSKGTASWDSRKWWKCIDKTQKARFLWHWSLKWEWTFLFFVGKGRTPDMDLHFL